VDRPVEAHVADTQGHELVGADHNILWFGEELAGEEGFEPSIS
jgi:hypothetical protein